MTPIALAAVAFAVAIPNRALAAHDQFQATIADGGAGEAGELRTLQDSRTRPWIIRRPARSRCSRAAAGPLSTAR